MIISLVFAFSGMAAAQDSRTDSVWVNGNCGMCKKTIEKNATAAGATLASWNKTTKYLQLTYDPAKTNPSVIQQAIAKAGYDTQDMKAQEADYLALEGCCQYDRTKLPPAKEK